VDSPDVGRIHTVNGVINMSEATDALLDLRNYVGVDIECYKNPDVKQALNDVVEKIDDILEDMTS
jgi:hypothetical protein